MAKNHIIRENIMMKPEPEKVEVYEKVDSLRLQGKPVNQAEHKSGFPAVTVDCEDIHIITDIISLEQWWNGKKKE